MQPAAGAAAAATAAAGPAAAAKARTAAVVQCPACGASITLRALGQSVMVACGACQTQLDVSRPDIQIIGKYREKVAELDIPLGTRGTLRGQMFEVIGAMQRSVAGYTWEEYLLFNPYIGFRWLVSDNGHWNLGRMVRENLSISASGVLEYQGRTFTKFQTGEPTVEWVVGEFYWRVAAGDKVRSSDYIAPPYMLSLEKAADEYTWTQLEYLEPSEVEAAFRISAPIRYTVGANQPNPAAHGMGKVMRIALAALALAIVFQVITAVRAHSNAMNVGTYTFDKSKPAEQVYGPFTFDEPFSLNELTAQAGVDNSWVELDCTLVNTVTGETREFGNAFSYYHGSDSDGAWSEGGTPDTSLVTSIPAGTYNLVVEGASGDDHDQRIQQSVSLSMKRDVVPWQNFWLVVLAIVAYPAYLAFRRYSFEKQRWSESDFSPYSSDD